MSATCAEIKVSQSATSWQHEFLTHILPAVRIIARVRFRGLPQVEREEATAEAVAGALITFLRLIQRGRNPIAFAGRLAQVAVVRVLAGRSASSPDRSCDVLSRQARQRRGFTVESLSEPGQAGSDWKAVLGENRRITPADRAASRIDFAEWLGRMQCRRREIAESLAAGFRTEEVAALFDLSRSRVSQLRREFEANWTEFQRDARHLGPGR